MHRTLQEARNGLVRQMLLISPKKLIQSYTHYLKNVSIFLATFIKSVAYSDFYQSLQEV